MKPREEVIVDVVLTFVQNASLRHSNTANGSI